ncbi:MAG: Methyltransferase type 12 [Pseudonocardiales bacterium]|nr:Methyltransferase type 12 [Pseudonocardiales bacterium]
MDAAAWDERYRTAELMWGVRPNRWVEQEVAGLPPGRALDLACGEGRNALWLASLGWQVIAVDFSAVALDKGRTLEGSADSHPPVEWVVGDATAYRPAHRVDLALVCYLQLVADERRRAIRGAADALAAGGTLLVVGHDTSNIAEGTGGPPDPRVLFTAADIVADLDGTGLSVERAEAVRRPVDGADRPAIDALVRAHLPTP